MAALEAHRAHLRAEGRLAIQRHRQGEGWLREALQERFGARGLARLGSVGLDCTLAAGAQPFNRLRELSEMLENTR
jgi:LAO/AO transport system kinase